MKTKSPPFARNRFGVTGLRSRTAAMIAGITVSACFACLLNAGVIDDFEGLVRYHAGAFGTNSAPPRLTNGQLVFAGRFIGPTPPDTAWMTHMDNVVWPSCLPGHIPDRHTLEVRMDLVSASADDVFLMLGVAASGAGYTVFVDQGEVSVWKNSGQGSSLPFWTSVPVTNEDVTVTLALTPMSDVLEVTTRILNKRTGELLFERSFLDGPDSDWLDPVPPPKGMTFMLPDSGAPYTTFTNVWAGVFQWTTTNPAPLEVVVDNLEYDLYPPPNLAIGLTTNGIALNWQKPFQDHVVVEADLLSGPWCPCPLPYSLTGRTLCLAMPCVSSQKFFKLVPGTQFIDDFSETTDPLVTRKPWVPYFWDVADASRVSFTVTNGVFRIRTLAPLVDGRIVIAPPGSLPVFGDFTASFDILHFAVGQDAGVCIYARGTIDDPFPGGSNAYLGQVYLNRIAIWLGDRGVPIPFTYDPAVPYRLQFSAVGADLTLRLINLTTGATLEQKYMDFRFSQGYVTLALPHIARGQSLDITLDNFIVTGTKP